MSGNDSREPDDLLHTRATSPNTHVFERRWSARKPIALDVVIYEQGLPVATAVSHNIGLEGMYVETSWHIFGTGTPLEAEFIIADRHRSRRYRLPVLVVHVSRRRFGLKFDRFDRELFRALEAILYGYDDSAGC